MPINLRILSAKSTRDAIAAILPAIVFLSGSVVFGQQDSGTILGAVRDAQDAIVPNATVTVTNVNTGVSKTTPVTSIGEYSVPFLVPGNYSVAAIAPGFKKSIRTGLELRVADQLVIDIKLEVGAVSESVTVEATAPLVDSASITLGQVIEARTIVELPLNGRDPTALAGLAPGVIPPAAPVTAAQGGNIPSINGGNSTTSTVTVDGASDMNPRGTTYLLLYTPNVDAVQEFKVQTNSMSAEYGRTNGGTISIVTRSGTNQVHGTVYWFIRNSDVDANDFFSNRAGLALGSLRRNQAGATAGGPLVIPKVYNGKDKTFFFVDYEAFREKVASPTILTVPTAAQRTGDFSQTFNAQGKLIQIFDPVNTIPSGSSVLRVQFPGNIIPASRIDAVAKNLVEYYPMPTSGAITGNLPLNPSIPNTNDTFDIRMDQYLGPHHFFGRGVYQQPDIGSANYFGNIGASSAPPLQQRRRQAMIHDVWAVTPTLVLDLNYSISYQHGARDAWSYGFDITKLGFPAYYAAGQEVPAIPAITLSGYTGIGTGSQNYSTQTAHLASGSMTKIFSRHHLKAGVEYNVFYNNQLQNGSAEGTFSLSPAATQGPNPNQASTTAGNSMATFLLGDASGSIINVPATSFRSSYVGMYAEDDITLTRNLTLFAGLRWDIDNPRTERYDRMSVLNLALPSSINGKVPGLNLLGQMTYPSGDQRRLIPTRMDNFGPRIGLAYRAPGNTVIRAGYGIFYGLTSFDATTSSGFSDGYSATTTVINTLNDVGQFETLSNPYPNGINRPLTTSQLTPSLNIGQATNSALLSLAVPQFQQFNFTLQHALSKTVLLEAAYVGNKGSHTSIANYSFNTLTASQMALGTYTQQLIPNPFYGVITDPTSALALPTVSRKQLMLPYPQYTTISSEAPSLGSSIYHSLQAKAEKRFSHGMTFLASYTLSKILTNGTGANIADPHNLRAERSVATWDVFQRVVLSGIYELPFGHGKRIGSGWNRGVDMALGGWQLNAITTFQGGFPLALTATAGSRPERIRPVQQLSGSIASRVNMYFDTGAFALPAAFTYGNAPPTEPDVRGPGIDNTDLSLSKNFRIKETMRAQLRFESFNTFNRVQFSNPAIQDGATSFGVITAQQNQPRKLQAAVKIIF
jgi:hypothetical protein